MDDRIDEIRRRAEGWTNGADNGTAPPTGDDLCLTLAQWAGRDIPEPDFLLGELFSTTTRALLTASTGLGKTNFAMALSFAMAAGIGFLHWKCRRAARVLFIDGEMSRRLFKRRLADATRRAGIAPATFFALCNDDIEAMSPLDTEEGQAFIERAIERIGGVDFIIFDNVQALLSGIMKEEESWKLTLPWTKRLTRRSIGQLWIHHTGHNKTHQYGTSTREWQMDTSILLEEAERPGTDIAFVLKFTKARERSPENRADFDPATISLAQDRWLSDIAQPTSGAKKAPKITPKANVFLRALADAVAAAGKPRPESAGLASATMDAWQSEAGRLGALTTKAKEQKKGESALFSKYRLELVCAGRVACNGNLAWIVPTTEQAQEATP